MRSTVAAAMPIRMTLARMCLGQAGGGHADDDRIVAGQHQVDHDDLTERDQLRDHVVEIGHQSSRSARNDRRAGTLCIMESHPEIRPLPVPRPRSSRWLSDCAA